MKDMLKEVIRFPDLYDSFNFEEQKKLEDGFRLLSTENLVKVMQQIPVGVGDHLYECVALLYVRRMATNQYQEKLLLDCLLLKRKDEEMKTGKYKEKFGKRKNLKKAKGKAYAKIRLQKINFH